MMIEGSIHGACMARFRPGFKNMCRAAHVEPLAFQGFVAHIVVEGSVVTMRSIRAFLLTLAGLTFVCVVAVFTASLSIALAGVATVLLFGQWLSSLLTGREREPVRAYAQARRQRQYRRDRDGELRVWNDGKGTIIDM